MKDIRNKGNDTKKKLICTQNFKIQNEFLDCSIEQLRVKQATVEQVTTEQDKQVIVNKLNENFQELKKQRVIFVCH
jgi:hypothetical protein